MPVTETDGKKLTEAQRELLHAISLRPHGCPVRSGHDDLRALADGGFVTDPHRLDDKTLFSRITDAGRAALSKSA